MVGINLLQKKKVETLEEARLKKIIYICGGGFLIFAVFLSLFLFFTLLRLQSQASELVALETSWTDKIKSLSDVESYNEILIQKLTAVKKIKKSVDFLGTIREVQSVFPEGLLILDMRIDDNGVLDLTGDAKNSTALLNFLDRLTGISQGRFKFVGLNSLSIAKEGNYKFTLMVKLLKAK